MNSQSFKNVFSKRLGCLVAVGEHASSQGKANGASVGRSVVLYAAQLTAACVLVSMAWAGPAGSVSSLALPSGGQLAQGVATVQQAGAVMNINQSTSKAVMNWNSFDIGSAAKVNIVQPGASAVMLNRVTSANPSQILGQLNANGQVVLVNPNGILFGKDGSVNASNFTASTLGVTDANFMAGNQQFERNGSTATVVNQGSIKTNGGYVALLGASVSNEGRIQTQGGVAYLAAAETVRIPVSGSGRIKLELSPSRINAAVANTKSGTIVTEGGQVYMQAAALNSAVASILQSGSIDTTGEQGGAVHLLADGGQIKVDGSITANSAGHDSQGQLRKGGDIVIGRDEETGVLAKASDVSGAKLESQGGFVETSGDYLKTTGISVQAKDWLLDPTDINIVATGTATPDTPSTSAGGTTTYQETAGINTSEVLKSTIESAINGGTNVTITTANPTVGANGAGNITLSTALSFSNTGATDATLTLLAKNGITQNAGASITTNSVTSTKLVNVVMTAEGKYAGQDVASANSQGISLGSTISTNGNITLSGTNNNTGGGSGLSFANNAGIKAKTITVTGVKLGTAGFGYGVLFNGTNVIESTGDTASVINGTSLSQATAYTYGTTLFDGSSVTFKTATNGNMVIKGSNAAWETGFRISAGYNTSTRVTTEGNITLGALEDKSQFSMRSGSIVSNSGSLKIYGQMSGGGTAVSTYDGASITANNGASIEIQGVAATSATGVGLGQNSPIAITTNGGGNISITASTATGSNAFVTGASTIDSSGTLTISGTASAGTGAGLNVNNAGSFLRAVGNIALTGNAIGNSGFYTAGAITSTSGGIAITGTSSSNIAANIQGVISAHNDLTITGTNTSAANTNSAVFFNNSATSVTGLIDIAATTSGSTLLATQLATGASLNTTNNAITVSTDSIDINIAGGTLSAGTGTVTIKNKSAGVAINVGGSDVGNATTTSRTLGLTNAELNRVTAGNLLIGSNTAGNLTVSSATTLANGRGNISLVTGGNIALSSNLETTGNGQSLTLIAANGSISGGGNITTAAGNTASITVDASTAGTLSGVISGGGSLVKQGASTLTLTGANNYTGTTTIRTGTLQVGSGGATGTLGSGGVSNNAALIFNRNAASDLSVANAISGTGSVEQAGAGKTILSTNNSYSGATSVSGGILQVGNGGATGTLGTANSVALSNNATLAFNKNVNTTIDKSIGGNGNVTANITGDLALTSDIALTGSNTINLTASGSITETAGSLSATNLYMTATAGSIGTTTQRIQSNVSALSLSSSGDQFVTETNGVTVSSRTTNNGNINLQTTNGTLTVGTVNSVAGIVAHGSGNITLAGTSTSGIGVYVGSNVSTSTGDVSITGTSSATTSFANPEAGVKSAATISGRDITMLATVTSTSGNVLGYYGAGGGFTASGRLNLTGTTSNASNGFYSFTGAFSSGTGMSISGTSASGQAVGLDNNVTFTNGNLGGIAITGTATNSAQQAIGLRGVAMNNSGGDVLLTGVNGIVYTDAGNAAWGNGVLTNTITNGGTGAVQVVAGNGSATNSGSINGSVFTITQNGNAGVVVSTSGTGNVTSPKIINSGTGDIVVAAGSLIAAGTETGGQILTVAGNTLAQTNGTPGKTYVYSGAPSTTGVLSNLNTGFNNLYYQGTGAAVNVGFNQGFDADHTDDLSVPGGGTASGTQVFFRAPTKPSFSLTLSNKSKVYGETDPVGWTSTNGASLTNAVAGVGGNNTFAVTTANVLAGLTGGRAAGENVGSYAYSLSTGNFNTTLTAQPNLVISRRDITLATLVASSKVYDGSTLATITSGTFGNLFNGETLLISGQGAFDDKNVADGKTVTVTDVSTLTKANGTGNWSNYNLTTTSKTTTANITKATLTVTAIDDGKIVTQADQGNFLGIRVDGLKSGDTKADVIAGLNISRTNAVNDTAAGTYLGVLVPTVAATVNYDFVYVNGNYTIVPARQLFVRTTDHNVVYGSTPVFDTTAAYLDVIGNPITNLTRTGTNNNYTFNDGAGTTVTMALKPYNGSSVATLSTSGNTVVGSYNVKDLAYIQTGSNFLGTPVFVGNLSVTPKAITPSASGVSKVYDATTSMANVSVGMTGKLANDLVTISGTGAFSQPTVGSSLGYAVTGVSLSSADAGNYFLANGVNSFSGNDGEITRATLVATANSRTTTFNGAAQTVTGFTVAGLLGSDSEAGLVGISASGATGTNVGTYANTMTVANQTNYTVTGVNGALTIDPAPILATDISAALRGTVSKVYDGTTAATLTPANYLLTGWLGSDGATVSKTLGAYNNANVGVGKTVTVSLSNSDYQATGATNLSNYSLPSSVSGTVGVITKKDVTLTGFTAANKVYDGNSLATITASNILTGVGSENLSVRGTANFSDKNVGVSKLVSISDPSALVKVDGTGQWTNYNLLNSTATTTANITPKLLQASGLVADKVYDGTAQATLSGSAGVGVVTGDTVFLQAGSALFADKHVSRDATGQVGPKTVTVSGLALAGADAGNYVLSAGSFQAQAKITPRILDLQVSVNDKPYDGTTTATARAAASNLIAGDAVQWDLGAGFFASKDVSRNALGQPLAQQVNFDNLQMTGLDSGNYSLPFTSVRTSAFITPKVLTVSGSSVADKNVDGNTDARVTLGAVQGLVGSEQLVVSLSGRFQTATPGGNKPVDVKYSWSDGTFGGKASNYALSDEVLLGRILSPQNDAIKPILPPLKPISGGGSVTIVAAQPAVASNFPASLPSPQAELVCTVTDLEPCDCEKTVLDGLDICLVPRNTQASRGNAGTSENGFTNRK